MARKSFSVLFFIKKAKLLKNGEAPVCMRITVNGCMVDISIKRSCPVNLWNQAKENSKGKDRIHGIAMGNSMPPVKEIAEYVTSDISDDGVKNALKHYGLI